MPELMTDEEVICAWMEGYDPRCRRNVNVDELSWWAARFRAGSWEFATRLLTLDALHEVETRLTEDQIGKYDAGMRRLMHEDPIEPWVPAKCHHWHADAPTRIKALAAVLRREVTHA
jgi:hypothetical protein